MATNAIIIEDVKSALKTAMGALAWQPTGQASPSGFVKVYKAQIYDGLQGSPICAITDDPPTVTNKGIKASFYGKMTPVAIRVYADYSQIDPEQAETDIVNAYEAVESYLCKASNMDALGLPGYEYAGWIPFSVEQTAVKGRKLVLRIQSKIDVT